MPAQTWQLQSLLQQWGSSLTCDPIARGRQITAEVTVRIKEKNSRTPQRTLLFFGNKPSLALQVLFTELRAVLLRSLTAMQINILIYLVGRLTTKSCSILVALRFYTPLKMGSNSQQSYPALMHNSSLWVSLLA